MRTLPRNLIRVGDAASQLRRLPPGSVDMVLTSPPYFRLRNYQIEGQLGLEPDVGAWVEHLQHVARELARVLTPTGTLWLNLGDTYSTHRSQGAGRKSLLLGPERVALTLVRDGWLLRNKIVWAKTNPMPSSVRDRLATTYEVIYVLARQPRYYFDLDAVREPHTSRLSRPQAPRDDFLPAAWRGPNSDGAAGLAALKRRGLVGHPLGKNPGDVWRLATAGYRDGHFATFPRSFAERAIRAGCPLRRCQRCRLPWRRSVGKKLGRIATAAALDPACACGARPEAGLVLDPFMGAGTTALAAEGLARDWLGIELNPEFATLAQRRIAAARRTDKGAAA